MNQDTVYIVSGFMRTGTSMMMRALEAGGLKAEYRPSRENMRREYSDEYYDPNEGGLYELELEDYKQIGFPRQYKGKLIKCLMGGLDSMAVCPKIKIVFMRRDNEEIQQSYEAFFGQKLQGDRSHFQEKVDMAIERMRNRKDVEIEVLWYRDVVENPLASFQMLAEKGWEIDPKKAADIVDEKLCRFRKELLAPGI